jgi:hypothetical protein
MIRLWKMIYVPNQEMAQEIEMELVRLRDEYPELEWDEGWDTTDGGENDFRCDFCKEQGIDECPHMGM